MRKLIIRLFSSSTMLSKTAMNIGRKLSYLGNNAFYDFVSNGKLANLKRTLPDTPVVIDVGANNGEWATELLKIRPDAKCVLVEPNPKLCETLRHLFANTKNVTVINAALSDFEGRACLNIPTGKDTHSSLETIQVGREDLEYNTVDIAMTTCDKLREDLSTGYIDFMKVDVEGHEMSVLKGFQNTIKAQQIDMLQIEYSEINMEKKVYFKDFFDFLKGWELGRICPGYIDIQPYHLKLELYSRQCYCPPGRQRTTFGRQTLT